MSRRPHNRSNNDNQRRCAPTKWADKTWTLDELLAMTPEDLAKCSRPDIRPRDPPRRIATKDQREVGRGDR